MNRINSLAIVLIFLNIAACGGGSGDSSPQSEENDVSVPSEGTVLSLSAEPLKNFKFRWDPVDGVDHYVLLENSDGISGFTVVADNISADEKSLDHSVALYSHINAAYILQSCYGTADSDCVDSNTVVVSDNLIDSIGYFKASNAEESDEFGYSVSLSGDGTTLAVGANRERSSSTLINGDQNDNAAGSSGAVYIFNQNKSGWTQQAYIKPFNTGSTDHFGSSIALSYNGNTLAVGAPSEDSVETGTTGFGTNNNARDSGAVYVFTRNVSAWLQQAYIKADNTGVDDEFGYSVSLSDDGKTLAVGAIREVDSTVGGYGAVYMFTNGPTGWQQQDYIKQGITGSDLFGFDVSLSGDGTTLAIGAPYEDSAARNINGDEDDDTATNSGAVYVYTLQTTQWVRQAYIKAATQICWIISARTCR